MLEFQNCNIISHMIILENANQRGLTLFCMGYFFTYSAWGGLQKPTPMISATNGRNNLKILTAPRQFINEHNGEKFFPICPIFCGQSDI